MLGEDVLYLPVTGLARRLEQRQLSPVELTESYLARIAQHGARLNAFATVTAELAREQARQAEDEIARGAYRGPLHGIPYAAKDLLATRGIPTTWGARPYEKQVFDYDADVISNLRQAGAVLLGKLAMVELAGGLGYSFADASLQGPGRNPWDPERWTGGSSSGPGAAVAAGLVGFAVGSETWGSIVCPSSFCGVTGLRPTFGRVSRRGAMALSWTMDKLGPMARSAADCRLALRGMAPPPPAAGGAPAGRAAPPDDLEPARPTPLQLRVGYLPLDFTKNGEKEVDRAVRAAVDELRSAGLQVEEAKLPEGPWEEAALTVISTEAVSSFEGLFRDGRVKLLSDRKAPFQERLADEIRGRDYVRAMRVRSVLLERMQELFGKYDLLLSPGMQYVSTPLPADLNKALAGSDPLGGIGNLLGLPALCVPCGQGAHGLPVAMVLVGPLGGERDLLQVGELYQGRTHWTEKHPTL
ncbi:MAG TPA: amidase [Candidatus Saccharimonadales bacterium]|nr:amidase [Candidatus Saccharimonadales bacterium]